MSESMTVATSVAKSHCESVPSDAQISDATQTRGGRENRMLNLDEAAEQLGYKRSGLYEIVQRTKKGQPGPQIQFFQIGSGPIKFRQEWLDDFVLENSIEPGQVVPAKKPKRGRPVATAMKPVEIKYSWGVSA